MVDTKRMLSAGCQAFWIILSFHAIYMNTDLNDLKNNYLFKKSEVFG